MASSEQNQPIDLKENLVDLATYRLEDRVAEGKPDPVILHVAYAYDNQIYSQGQIMAVDKKTYQSVKDSQPNELVNKFGQAYAAGTPLLLHKRLADVLIDTAIDMRDRYDQFTVVMDGLRTYESGRFMEKSRPDLVEAKLLARAGASAHNRALAVDSKLFELTDPSILDEEGRIHPSAISKGVAGNKIPLSLLVEADEKGHLDDLNMATSSRFHKMAPSDPACINRLNRLRAWQRASVKNKFPIANLLSEFWDDRVPGSPSDMWRVLSCRAMCIGMNGDPKTNPVIQKLKTDLETLQQEYQQGVLNQESLAESAHVMLVVAWDLQFNASAKRHLEQVLGEGGGIPPELPDFVFHEWLQTIHDRDLEKAGFPAQAATTASERPANGVYTTPRTGRIINRTP